MSVDPVIAPGAGGVAPRPAAAFAPLVVGCIGVVYGDIGTSPLYALREALLHAGEDGLEPEEVVGIVSLLLWTLTLTVSVKYVSLVLKADNNGEGGVLSLMALAQRFCGRTGALLFIGILAASLFYGDAIITPAISVLSAMEGLRLVSPQLAGAALPLTLAILTGLFAAQTFGTARIARLFGPVTILWFLVLGGLGLAHIGDEPAILAAINPLAALGFVADHGLTALAILGTVFLAVTGAEALYADLGHFGRAPIRFAWGTLVFPALALNYLGQGALILSDPGAVENPFFLLAPSWALAPLVILATLATVIAAQAVITGAFSLTHQAIQLGLLPRMEVRHTSDEHAGQIYIPRVNFLIYLGVVGLVLFFGSSGELAGAYGIAVAGNMMATSILAVIVFRQAWGWAVPRIVLVMAPIVALETLFLGANLTKIADGGYVPVGLAVVLLVVMGTFVRGTRLVADKAQRDAVPMDRLAAMLERSPPATARGMAVFMTADPQVAPSSLLHNLKHNGVLHERNLILTVRTADRPRVGEGERLRIEPINARFSLVTVTFGYMEEPNVPAALALARRKGLAFEIMSTSFFLSRRSLRALPGRGMPNWQDRLYIALNGQVADATQFYRLPTNRVVEMGQQLAI
ncbi:potassium transporter Kup [Aureimonas populi]|uniref:Probable potassium transport system protein Kup n=1 Tax=Aureimonas populi TaxID=1701758 RepID=A0ABW5CQ62_9HYPH|nr:potassium transporter Kup [Aureimonas populi]